MSVVRGTQLGGAAPDAPGGRTGRGKGKEGHVEKNCLADGSQRDESAPAWAQGPQREQRLRTALSVCRRCPGPSPAPALGRWRPSQPWASRSPRSPRHERRTSSVRRPPGNSRPVGTSASLPESEAGIFRRDTEWRIPPETALPPAAPAPSARWGTDPQSHATPSTTPAPVRRHSLLRLRSHSSPHSTGTTCRCG